MSEHCRVCHFVSEKLFSADLLGSSVQYFECSQCGYVQTESPYWHDRAYADAINDSDTGILKRNRFNSHVVFMTLLSLGSVKGMVADFAGGYGLLVRQLRDLGVDALWSDKYCKNLFARGFEYREEHVDLVTAFEVFEHFEKPMESLEQMLRVAPNVLISTEIMPLPTPDHADWWYYGREHGQHIGFFRIGTLRYMANSLRCRLISDGKRYHLFTRMNFPAVSWNVAIKARCIAPCIAYFLLNSKTWLDHEKIDVSTRLN